MLRPFFLYIIGQTGYAHYSGIHDYDFAEQGLPDINMKSPRLVTWVIALLIFALGLLLKYKIIAIVGLPFALNPFWVVSAAFVLLALATILPGL